MAEEAAITAGAPTRSAGQLAGGDAVVPGLEMAPPATDAPNTPAEVPVTAALPQVPAPAPEAPHAPADVPPPGVVILSEAVQRAIETPPLGSPAAKRRASRTQVVDPRVSRAKFDQQVKWFRDYEDVQRRRGFLLIEATFPRVVVAVCVPHVSPYIVLFAVAIDYTNWDLEPPSVRIVDPFSLRPLLGKELISFMKRQAPRGQPVVATGAPSIAPAMPPEPTPVTTPIATHATTPGTTPGTTPVGEIATETTRPTSPTTPIATESEAEAPSVTPGAPDEAPPARPLELCMLQFGLPNEVPFLCLTGVREYHDHPAHTGDAWWLHRTTGAGSLSHLLNVFHSYAIAPIKGIVPLFTLRVTPAGITADVRGVTLSTDLPA